MGKFVVKQDILKQYRFVLKANNNEIIGKSSEGYPTKQACVTGINSVKANAYAKVVDTSIGESGTGSRYEIFYSSNQYWFRLIAINGEKILASESYITKQSCKNGIDSVKANAPTAEIVYE